MGGMGAPPAGGMGGPMGGMGGGMGGPPMGGAPGGAPPGGKPMNLMPVGVWDVLEKLLQGKSVEGPHPKKDQPDESQQQPPAPAPGGDLTGVGQGLGSSPMAQGAGGGPDLTGGGGPFMGSPGL